MTTPIKARKLATWCREVGIGRTKALEEISAGRLQARRLGTHIIITEQATADYFASLPAVAPKAA